MSAFNNAENEQDRIDDFDVASAATEKVNVSENGHLGNRGGEQNQPSRDTIFTPKGGEVVSGANGDTPATPTEPANSAAPVDDTQLSAPPVGIEPPSGDTQPPEAPVPPPPGMDSPSGSGGAVSPEPEPTPEPVIPPAPTEPAPSANGSKGGDENPEAEDGGGEAKQEEEGGTSTDEQAPAQKELIDPKVPEEVDPGIAEDVEIEESQEQLDEEGQFQEWHDEDGYGPVPRSARGNKRKAAEMSDDEECEFRELGDDEIIIPRRILPPEKVGEPNPAPETMKAEETSPSVAEKVAEPSPSAPEKGTEMVDPGTAGKVEKDSTTPAPAVAADPPTKQDGEADDPKEPEIAGATNALAEKAKEPASPPAQGEANTDIPDPEKPAESTSPTPEPALDPEPSPATPGGKRSQTSRKRGKTKKVVPTSSDEDSLSGSGDNNSPEPEPTPGPGAPPASAEVAPGAEGPGGGEAPKEGDAGEKAPGDNPSTQVQPDSSEEPGKDQGAEPPRSSTTTDLPAPTVTEAKRIEVIVESQPPAGETEPGDLSQEERRRRYDLLNKKIKTGLRRAFRKTAEYLGEVIRLKLYKVEFDTVDEYLGKKWGMTRSYASRLTGGAAIAKEIEEMLPPGNIEAPTVEAQTRVLKALETKELRLKAWVDAHAPHPGIAPTPKELATIVQTLKSTGNGGGTESSTEAGTEANRETQATPQKDTDAGPVEGRMADGSVSPEEEPFDEEGFEVEPDADAPTGRSAAPQKPEKGHKPVQKDPATDLVDLTMANGQRNIGALKRSTYIDPELAQRLLDRVRDLVRGPLELRLGLQEDLLDHIACLNRRVDSNSTKKTRNAMRDYTEILAKIPLLAAKPGDTEPDQPEQQ